MSGRAASLGHGMRADPERIALGILRVSLAASLLLGVEKFVLPEATVRIWGNLYGVSIDRAIVPVIGLLEGALAIAIGLGLWRRVSYGLGTIVHGISVLSTWRQLVDRPLHGRPGIRARVGGDGPAGVRSARDDPASGGCPEFRPEQWFEVAGGQLVPRQATSRGYHQVDGVLQFGVRKPALHVFLAQLPPRRP